MLVPADDLPVHQTTRPLAEVASGDRNHYDRYFCNGYDADGDLVFGVALGIYPNRQVIDAACSVVHGGVQRSLYASGRLGRDRTLTRIGPIAVEVVEPLRTLRVTIAADDLGFSGALHFHARSVAIEEPHFQLRGPAGPVFDYTRLTQFGSWTGELRVDGVRHEIDPTRHLGCRDRSWGVRPVGEPPGGAPAHELPQFFWLWAPLQFDDQVVHVDVNEHADGARWHQTAATAGLLAADDDPCAASAVSAGRDLHVDVDWLPGTRRARSAHLAMTAGDGTQVAIDLEPVARFQMRGLGYVHPTWSHGTWRGELEVGTESWVLDDLDPLDVTNLHVQQVVRATWGGRSGVGVLEQLAIGPHEPSGLSGFLDGAGA